MLSSSQYLNPLTFFFILLKRNTGWMMKNSTGRVPECNDILC